MIWIEIEGLPLNARTVNAFKRIASNWGETVFVDEDADENIASGRVCIKTRIKTHILDSCLVSIKGVSYQSGASDNDIHDINELQEEEGEINDKEEPFGHQMNAPGSTRIGRQEVVETENHVVDDRQTQTSTNSLLNLRALRVLIFKREKIQSQGKTSRVCSSNASSQSVRPSHTRRSQSKMGQSTGSMIDNFLRHINMGNALGYDMSGSQSDLKKFIDSIGVKHGN
ncbi:hypothetical protein Tco_1189510 [Tanacetum coccineum]